MPTLNWIGKDKVITHHQDVPYRVLEHKYGYKDGKQSNKETGSGNMVIHGDNLEALKALLPKFQGKISFIYESLCFLLSLSSISKCNYFFRETNLGHFNREKTWGDKKYFITPYSIKTPKKDILSHHSGC